MERPAVQSTIDLRALLADMAANRSAVLDYITWAENEIASARADLSQIDATLTRLDPAHAASLGITVTGRQNVYTGPRIGTRANRPAFGDCVRALGNVKATQRRHGPALAVLLAAVDTVLSANQETSPAAYDLHTAGDSASLDAACDAARRRWRAAGFDPVSFDTLAAALHVRAQSGRLLAGEVLALVAPGENAADAARRIGQLFA